VAVIGSTVSDVRLNDCKKVSRAKLVLSFAEGMPRAQRKTEIPLSSPFGKGGKSGI
jgi:hypothetical protein